MTREALVSEESRASQDTLNKGALIESCLGPPPAFPNQVPECPVKKFSSMRNCGVAAATWARASSLRHPKQSMPLVAAVV